MKHFYLILVSTLLLWPVVLVAQQEVNYSLYRYHLNLLNPATTGTQGGTYLNMSLRTQWVGVDEAPETQAISMGTPNKKDRLGTGFSIINDQAFIERQTQLFFDFSYRLPMGDQKNLYLGLKAGGTSIRLFTDRLENTQENDPFLQGNMGFVPNIGVGIYYKTPRFYLSTSIPRLLNTERFSADDGQVSRATDRPHLFTSFGFFIPVSHDWDLVPAGMISYVEAAPIDYVFDLGFSFQKRFDFGVQYNHSSISGGFGAITSFQLKDGLQFGYAYVNSSMDQVNHYSAGTHELVLKIKLGNHSPDRTASFTTTQKKEQSKNEKRVGAKNKEQTTN